MEKDLSKIYKRLKSILKKYENPLKPKMDLDGKYDLWSFKALEIEGRKRTEVYFAGLIIQSKYVGFYFMPVYSDVNILDVFKPELLKTLKGKSCFHIKYLDDTLEKQIKEALEIGYKLYKKRGWI
ncbi:MAG: hypothetical protein A2X61_08285 [Ignavibacteria bacterium GWB2_35_12]|nr:MAG: hypothetical protein A2X63_03135 [Ignavibacteria bacterium GWA2_35_8]OGU40728.1 MAG: hypothetical protein A2X61_08285 [Ignavibacteria bacterium GWB2_35_12]OGU90764.1 MAG: hypothetical protein A2220_05435 [Ignavibacteria bacterium RIFOXYA2_FULL_35_10]OGV23722.1 MAG: hypothetical protein A2475_02200 [Ignavibacteria bacterium RIFOXYC2_FULL_35_21]